MSINPTTKEIVKILGIGSVVIASVAFPGLPKALISTHKLFKKYNSRQLGYIIKRLEKQRVLKIKENANQTRIELTEKGKRRILEYDFENIEIKAKRRDGKWRLVIFDIPEEKKSNRDVFRRKLLQLGMVRVQDSIFACAFPCKNEVDFLVNFLSISDFVTLVVVDKIERGEQLLFKQYKELD